MSMFDKWRAARYFVLVVTQVYVCEMLEEARHEREEDKH